MGRIKTQMIKRVSKKLIRDHADKFTESYEKNKEVVSSLVSIYSPKIRNVISGYITRLKKAGVGEQEV